MIIGITGTNGAGKGTVVDYLVQKGFIHKSVRSFLTEEISKQNLLPEDRGSLRDMANTLRKEHGPAYVIQQLYEQAKKEEGADVVIESIRAIGEADFLKSVGASILAVDADKQIRYERVTLRGSLTDKVTFEEFSEQEDREMAATEPWDMNISGVIKMADIVITNDGTLEELHAKIDALPIFK